MLSSKPKILVTNDDGIDSPGIYSLVRELKSIADITVVAPDRQQSAVGHALTVSVPLRATPFHRKGQMFGYAINGTPSDCVKLAVSTLLPQKPDMIVSGINHGQNTSINILYSGTVSAATEGMLLGIPSIAVSLDSYSYKSDCTIAAEYAGIIVKKVLSENILTGGTLLNINVPDLAKNEIKGIKYTRRSRNIWMDSYEEREDPFGRKYYWFAGELQNLDEDPETDLIALREGYVSVTPVKYAFTDNSLLSHLNTLSAEV